MGILKTVFNDFFGSERTYEVKDLGVFTCKACRWWLDKEYSWTAYCPAKACWHIKKKSMLLGTTRFIPKE